MKLQEGQFPGWKGVQIVGEEGGHWEIRKMNTAFLIYTQNLIKIPICAYIQEQEEII